MIGLQSGIGAQPGGLALAQFCFLISIALVHRVAVDIAFLAQRLKRQPRPLIQHAIALLQDCVSLCLQGIAFQAVALGLIKCAPLRFELLGERDEPVFIDLRDFALIAHERDHKHLGTLVIAEAVLASVDAREVLPDRRRLADLDTDDEIENFAAELRDRFRVLPDEVRYLFKVAAIKAYCRRANVEKVDAGPKGAVISFRDNKFAQPERLVSFIRQHGQAARVRPDMKVVFFQDWETPEERMKCTGEILRQLAGLAETKKAA